MTYVEGFVVAVPTENKEDYRKHAAEALPLFKEFGVQRMVENWGDDVPKGKVTDFYGAVQAKDDETIVFSWFEYPDKATRDAANEKMMSDPQDEGDGREMPFDGQRMIFGGFDAIVDEKADGHDRLYRRLCPAGARTTSARPIARWRRRSPASSGNMARCASSRPGATTCRDGKVTDYRRR